MGWDEMEGISRRIWIMLAEVVSAALGGTNMPSSRNVLMLEVRRREEADGERRMMGWTFWCGFLVIFETRAGWGAEGFESRVRKKDAAVLR